MKCTIEGLRTADGRNDFVGSHVDLILRCKLFNEQLAQAGQAGRWCVVCLVFDECAYRREFDIVWCLEVGFATVEAVHLLAFCPQGHDLVADLNDV